MAALDCSQCHTVEEVMKWFEGLDREQLKAVFEFAAHSLEAPPSSTVSR
ncbi:MAG TPA: hypothetical protein VKP58_04235 [Candidatus Acidoferrum sp.]|nr:hypothetical protein [Candidatus Acidoferrum sp.]